MVVVFWKAAIHKHVREPPEGLSTMQMAEHWLQSFHQVASWWCPKTDISSKFSVGDALQVSPLGKASKSSCLPATHPGSRCPGTSLCESLFLPFRAHGLTVD